MTTTDDLDFAFSGIRLQLHAWLALEADLGKPLGWAFEQHAEHMGPRHELAELRRQGGDPATIDLLQAAVDVMDRLAEDGFDPDEPVGYPVPDRLGDGP